MEIAGQPPYWDDAYSPTLSLADGAPEQGAWAFRWGVAFAVLGLLAGGLMYLAGAPTLALIIVGGSVTAGAALSPLVGLCLVIMSFSFDAVFLLKEGAFTSTKALAIITLLMFLPRVPRRRIADFFGSRPLRFYTALAVLYVVFFLFSIDRYFLARSLHVMVWVLTLGLAMLVASIPRSFKQLQIVCLSATVGAGLIGLWILMFGVDSLVQRGGDVHRLNVGDFNENALAYILGVGLFLSGIAWYGASKKVKTVIVFNNLMAVIAIGLSGSRASWLALVVGVTMGILLAKRVSFKYRSSLLVVFALAGIGGFFAISWLAPDRVEHLLGRMSRINVESSGGRVQFIWPMYWKAYIENPLFGVGPGSRIIIGGLAPHSDIMSTLASTGSLGIILLAGLYWTLFNDARRNTVPWLRMVSVSGVFFCITFGLTHDTLIMKASAAFLGVMACMTNLGMCPRPGSVGSDSDEYVAPNPAASDGYRPL